jgi:hypothetical protein
MLQKRVVLSLDDVKKEILEFCLVPHSPADILDHIHVVTSKHNYGKFVIQLLDQRFIMSALLRKRNYANQKFVITQKGINYLHAIA